MRSRRNADCGWPILVADDDYILDVSGVSGPKKDGPGKDAEAGGKPFISITFECCNVYQRVYRNAEGTAYVGWCPKCARKVVAQIGPDGVDARFFRAR